MSLYSYMVCLHLKLLERSFPPSCARSRILIDLQLPPLLCSLPESWAYANISSPVTNRYGNHPYTPATVSHNASLSCSQSLFRLVHFHPSFFNTVSSHSLRFIMTSRTDVALSRNVDRQCP